MTVQELLYIIREFPMSAEVLIDVGGELEPITAGHVGVLDGKVVLAPIAAPEPPKVRKPKAK